MIPLSSTLPSQIRFLLHSASDSNSDSIFRELCQFVDYGIEGSILLLGTCLDQLNLKEQDVTGSQMKHEIVSSVFKYLLDKPNFCTVLCLALRGSLMNGEFLEELSKTLNLSIEQKIAVGLALSESEDLDFRTEGHNFCISQIEDLTVSSNLIVSNEHIQDIVLFLCRSEGLSKHVDSFTKILSLVPRNGSSLFAQAPVLADDISSINSSRQLELFYEGANSDFEAVLAEIEEEMSMADILKELGYGCTVNASHCKEILSLFLPLNEVTLSKLLGTIARSHVGLNDAQNIHSSFYSAFGGSATVDPSSLNTWNVDVLVDSIKQLAPKTDWTCVMENLDHEGFNIPDETSFSLLMSIYNKACEAPFPLHAICGSVWQNAEGQLSFLRHAVSAPPDVFTFAHCSRHLHVEIVLPMEKQRRLEQIIRTQEHGSKFIIFCSTKRLCDQLARSMRGYGAAAIHGDKSQGERDYVLNQFRCGKAPILVATDVAARGLDIKDIRSWIWNGCFPALVVQLYQWVQFT